MNKNMTSGTPWKLLVMFSMPIIAGNLLQQMYHTADTLIVGNVEGEVALSAVGSCTSLTELFIALAIGFSTGAGILIAQCYGAERYDLLRNYASTAIVLLLSLGVVMSVAGVLAGKVILEKLLHVPDYMLGMTLQYFRIYSLGLIFQFGYNVYAAILRAIGDSSATLYILMGSSFVNVLLDLLLVSVLKFGVSGAAVATVVSQACACIASISYTCRKYKVLRLGKSKWHYDYQLSLQIMKVGAPMALQSSIISLGMMMVQKLVNSYGQIMMASFAVVTRLNGWITMPIKSLQSAMATYAGQNIGAKKEERISIGLWQSIAMSISITAFICIIIYFNMETIVRWFGLDAEASEICMMHLRVTLPSVLLFAAYFPMNGVLQGVGDAVHATAYAIISLALRILFSYTLSMFDYWGYTAIWWSETYAWIIVIAVYYVYYFQGKWKRKVLIS